MEAIEAGLGPLVRRTRLARGMTQEDLAEKVGMSQRWLSEVESGGIRQPRLPVLRRLADALGLDASDLYIAANLARTRADAARIDHEVPATGGDAERPALTELVDQLRGLSDEDLKAVATFVTFLATQRRQRSR
jgi:transcriptional regulator with XRE-family HTH domain